MFGRNCLNNNIYVKYRRVMFLISSYSNITYNVVGVENPQHVDIERFVKTYDWLQLDILSLPHYLYGCEKGFTGKSSLPLNLGLTDLCARENGSGQSE